MKNGEKVAVVERYVAAYNARDMETVLALYRDDATMEDPVGSAPAVGKEALAALYQQGFDMGVTLELDGRIRCGGSAAAFPMIGTTDGGKLYIVDIFEFDESGKVEGMRAYWSPDDVEGEMDL